MSNIRFVDNVPVSAYGSNNAASTATSASYASTATSASYASTASFLDGNAISASYATTASYALFAVSASHEIVKEVSSSHANTADVANGLQGQPLIYVTNITASGDISSSGTIITENGNVKNNLTVGGNLDIADTIYHTGDSNTKIRFPAVDTISFHTSGDERLRISPDGNISSSNNLTINNITSSGDILLDEDQRIFFEADKNTYIESHASDSFRAVVNNRQMFLLDEDTGNRAVFGNGTKVFIGADNNHLPSNQLEVSGSVSILGGGTAGGHITASGNISSSATSTASFGTYLGDGSQLSGISTTPFPFTGDAQITGSLNISGSTTISTGSLTLGTGSLSVTGSVSFQASSGGTIFSIGPTGSFTLGEGATTTLDSQVAIGYNATANSSFDISIGGNSNASGGNSVAIGRSANAGADGIAIGMASAGANGVTMGQSSAATGNGVSIGYDSETPASSISLGANAKSSGANSITLNANGSATSTSTANALKVFITSNSTPDFEITNTHITASGNISGSSISTASFGTYLGDGSQLTGIVTATDLSSSIFVSPSGNDTTGTVGDLMKPFKTLNSASQAATTGSTIFVYPGTYTAEAENLAFEGGSYYFYPGTVVSKSAAGDVFNITDFNVGFNVYGHADFYLTSSAESLYEGGTNGNEILFNTTFECQDITSDTGTDYLFRDAHKSSVISIKAREITTDEGGFFQYTGGYTDYPEIKIDIDRAYLGERFINPPAGYLNVNANYVRSTNNSAISQFYYIAAGTFNIGYCQGNSYAYDIGNATQNQHIVINGYANAINISGNHDVQHNGHCYDLTISSGRYVGNSVGKFTMSGGEADIIYNQQADSYSQNPISVSGGAAQIELLSQQNTYFTPISISGGQVILTGGYYGYSSNYSVTVSGGELIYKAHIDYSVYSSTNKNPITLTGGLLRMQGYVKNQLTDSDSTPQQSTCIKKTGGTLILDGATLIVSSSVAPPIWAPNQSEEVKIYAGGVNTNKTGSLGLLAASSSFGSGAYALTNPLGGMIIEDASVE